MTLAKKAIRHITVNGARFRWRVAPNDEPGMAIVVESVSSTGQRMVTWVEHGNTISPRLVRHTILHALRSGWHPEQRGPELELRLRGLIYRETDENDIRTLEHPIPSREA